MTHRDFAPLKARKLFGRGKAAAAVEGLETVSPLLDRMVVPVTICILVALFSIQRFGTAAVGRTFGKVMLLWFLLLGATGFVHVLRQPSILAALNPAVGLKYVFSHGLKSTVVLGSVFLAVTGGEALYADMGHLEKHRSSSPGISSCSPLWH
jgi:KUP system potassium uptake protein